MPYAVAIALILFSIQGCAYLNDAYMRTHDPLFWWLYAVAAGGIIFLVFTAALLAIWDHFSHLFKK